MKVKNVVVFDLDDTLYNEIDFLKSAYNEISLKLSKIALAESSVIYNQMLKSYYNNENAFEKIIETYTLPIKIEELLNIYRNHKPNIKLTKDRIKVLDHLQKNEALIGLITDGRSKQQRNKIEALQLNSWISEIVISEEFGSEKPNINNYKHFEKKYGEANYYYIGDNVKKDFISPNELNWTTICLKNNGLNIHKQDVLLVSKAYLAKYTILKFSELINIILSR